uniref:Uncharacterized protein n=1 Tax=Arundo donax TaxID=35708 RepID=A0A0A9HI39_ARUDO
MLDELPVWGSDLDLGVDVLVSLSRDTWVAPQHSSCLLSAYITVPVTFQHCMMVRVPRIPIFLLGTFSI